MRPAFGVLHRWAGLLIAGFLFFSALTGAVISWDHELDAWLNPHLLTARAPGPALPPIELAKLIEARHPEVQVTFVPLSAELGHALAFGVDARLNPASAGRFDTSFNQVFIDPANGAELGKREWGAVWPITKETVVSFLYVLHYSLHVPEMWGTDRWGIWLLGGVALIWTLDCFVGFYLTLPARQRARLAPEAADANGLDAGSTRAAKTWWQRWQPAWAVRWTAGPYKLNFDLHRAGGLWAWGVLFSVAFTAFSLNLYRELFFPAMSWVSDVTPTPFDEREPAELHALLPQSIGFEHALGKARSEATRRGWEEPAGGIIYARELSVYSVAFFRPEDGHGAGGVGHRELYIDAHDGRVLGGRQPWAGTAADIFIQAQFPVHSGRILGLPGRVLISLTGLVVALLSVTGVVIWWKKQKARASARARRPPGLRRRTALRSTSG